jgi:hypothetical protein
MQNAFRVAIPSAIRYNEMNFNKDLERIWGMIRNQKTKRIIAGVIAGILVIAMVAGTIISALVSVL